MHKFMALLKDQSETCMLQSFTESSIIYHSYSLSDFFCTIALNIWI